MKPIFTECGCEFEHGAWVTATCEHGREFTQARWGDSWKLMEVTTRPTIICLCGSTRFSEAFQRANFEMTLAGKIILTIGCDTKCDDDLFSEMSPDDLVNLKKGLDTLHFRKIDMADEVLILNVDGYIGESTSKELAYAKAMGKRVRFLEGSV